MKDLVKSRLYFICTALLYRNIGLEKITVMSKVQLLASFKVRVTSCVVSMGTPHGNTITQYSMVPTSVADRDHYIHDLISVNNKAGLASPLTL